MSPTFRITLFWAACLVSSGHAYGQAADSDFQSWNAVAITGPVAKDGRILVWFDGHARFSNDASDLGVTILRPAIGWRVSDRLDLWGGYARVDSRTEGQPDIEEDRLWQQATFPLPSVLGGTLGGRSRLEQRFRDTGADTGWRFRQFIRWARPIRESDWSLVAWDELFISLNDTDWGQRGGFDQNRLFAGAAWQPTARARFELGYLNNALDTPTSDIRVNHNLSLTLFVSL